MIKLHRQPLTLIIALIMLFATSFSSVTAVGADTPITASISLQSVPPNGTTSRIIDVFPDPGLAAAVAEELGKDVDDIVSEQELAEIESLPAGQRNIESIDGVQYLVNLESLDLENNQISDLTLLAELTGLESLYLPDNQISDLTQIAGLTSLQMLGLGYNQISDISPLAGLTDLRSLSLYGNQISDISPLAGLTSLRRLDLHNNQISDLNPLAGLTDLEWVSLMSNRISDITLLTGLTSLFYVNLCHNYISDITPLADLDLWNAAVWGQTIVLDNTAVNNATAVTIKNIDGTVIPLDPEKNGTYEDGMLTWTQAGDNQAEWSINITFDWVTTFAGTVSQYVHDYTIDDILTTRDFIFKRLPEIDKDSPEFAAMDMNNDGRIDIFDLIRIRDAILR